MMQAVKMLGIAMAATLSLAACGGEERAPRLMYLKTASGPDEFAILPTKPLQMPDNLAELPTPTPGGANRTDPTPARDAVAALGGNPARLDVTGDVPQSDIVAYATRGGVDPSIRQTLAAEDLQYRRDNDSRLLQRLFRNTTYYQAYSPMALDQLSEQDRWQRAGARTPAAPPSQADQEAAAN